MQVAPELVVFAGDDTVGCGVMAAAWFQSLADPRRARAVVAGPRGSARVQQKVAALMAESGAGIDSVQMRSLTPALLRSADLIVTLGNTFARRLLALPPEHHLYREHWMVGVDSVDQSRDGHARDLRDLIRSRVAMLVFTEGWGRADISKEAARVTRPRRQAERSASF